MKRSISAGFRVIICLVALAFLQPEWFRAYQLIISTKSTLASLQPDASQPFRLSVSLFCIPGISPAKAQIPALQAAINVFEIAQVQPILSASAYRLAGQAYCLLEDETKAFQNFTAARRQDPGDALSSIELFAIAVHQRDDSAAYNLIVEGNISPSELTQGVTLLIGADQLIEALTWCHYASQFYPNERQVWLTWFQVGWEYEKGRDWASAAEVYRSALAEEDKNRVSFYRGSFYFRLGATLAIQNSAVNQQSALEFYNLAIQDGSFKDVWDELSVYIYRGNWYRYNLKHYPVEVYLLDYQKALEVYPKSSLALMMIGIVYLEDLKEFDQAEKYLDQAVTLSPDYATPYYYLGNTFLAQMNYKAAARAYRTALEIDPDLLEAQKQLDVIESTLDGEKSP